MSGCRQSHDEASAKLEDIEASNYLPDLSHDTRVGADMIRQNITNANIIASIKNVGEWKWYILYIHIPSNLHGGNVALPTPYSFKLEISISNSVG